MRRFTASPAAPLSRFIAQSLTAALLISVVMGEFDRAVAQQAPANPATSPATSPAVNPAASPAANPAASPSNPAANPAPASDAPAAVTQLISQIDAAANQRNLQAVLRFYSPQFTHSDGLTRQTLESTLQQVWERYPNLSYQTAIDSWKQESNGYVVETTTTITGNQTIVDRPSTLTSTIRSRQQIQGNQIVQQEILSEVSRVDSGAEPPTVEVILPEQVTIGQSFDFDAIVQEPLENRILLGAVQDEPVSANGYLQTTPLEFEVLSAGGLFKQGRAAAVPGERWISGVVVRDNGMTAVSQRMQVVRP